MANEIPNGFKICPCCDGSGEIYVGQTPAVYYTFDGGIAPEDIMKTCEECDGEEVVPDYDDSDPVPSDDDFDDSMDGDAESALASAGFGTDEDYGGASDIDF